MNNTCRKCGKCCKVPLHFNYINVIVLPEDIIKIAQCLDLNTKDFVTRYCIARKINFDKDYLIYVLRACNGQCIFLHDDLCTINNCKPIQCKQAPNNFFASTALWDYLPCTKKSESLIITDTEKEFVKSIIKGYDIFK